MLLCIHISVTNFLLQIATIRYDVAIESVAIGELHDVIRMKDEEIRKKDEEIDMLRKQLKEAKAALAVPPTPTSPLQK